MTLEHSAALADEADLTYVTDDVPGIRRVRRGRGFEFLLSDGGKVAEPDRERIRSLVIPPAWTDVWISRDPRGHLQATGRDSAGRKQYLYHDDWNLARDDAKFDRLAEFGVVLPRLRRTVTAELGKRGLARERVVALVVALLDLTLIRVGNLRYAMDNESFGLTTFSSDHVEVDGAEVCFSYSGKSGREHQVALRDRRLAGLVSRCQELGGQRLFSYEGPEGTGSIDSTDVNDFVREATGGSFTAKDFRTWGGSSVVAGELGPMALPQREHDVEKLVIGALDEAAAVLGNSRAVCRAAYVHPLVVESFADGTLNAVWKTARRSKTLAREERALLKLLQA